MRILVALLGLFFLTHCQSPMPIDYQGHRGARGLYPENTLPAFLHVLEYPAITTLEMDVVLTAENVVVVSHEPWMSSEICLDPDGRRLPEADSARRSIRQMRIGEVQAYDCGTLPHPRFPQQRKLKVVKPRLSEVFAAVEGYCRENDRPLPGYNIEIKYLPEWEAAGFCAPIMTNVEAVLAEVAAAGLGERVTLQCFHPPVLAEIHRRDAAIQLAYLDEFPQTGSVSEKMDDLGFRPAIYSPWHEPLTEAVVAECQSLGLQVIPWTVNETATMERLIDWGVAGIITDYPDRIPLLTASK